MCFTLPEDWEWYGMYRFSLLLKNVVRHLEIKFGAIVYCREQGRPKSESRYVCGEGSCRRSGLSCWREKLQLIL